MARYPVSAPKEPFFWALAASLGRCPGARFNPATPTSPSPPDPLPQTMFTGIIEAAVPVLACESQGTGLRLTLGAPTSGEVHGKQGAWDVGLGDSVAVSGTCLTVAAFGEQGEMIFDLSAETVDRTWFASLKPGQHLNLERALKLDARLDGHLVSGHVDGGATVVEIQASGDGGCEISFQADTGQDRYLVEKGSVTLDGVSLTVISPSDGRFHVALIPLTLELTTLGDLEVGDRVNLEADMIGKWVERLLPPQA